MQILKGRRTNNTQDPSDEQRACKEDMEDRFAKLQLAEERIEEYKKHQLRSSYSYKVRENEKKIHRTTHFKVRENMVDTLTDGVALITLDFGQKFLPTR